MAMPITEQLGLVTESSTPDLRRFASIVNQIDVLGIDFGDDEGHVSGHTVR
jgi:hypothetical protein